MDNTAQNAVDETQFNICRCCLKAGCNKSISELNYYLGEKQVYGEMLRKTFDIQLLQQGIESVTYMICEDCITKLQDAAIFKQMVLGNEEHYLQIIRTLKLDLDEGTRQVDIEVKLEEIKCESPNVMAAGDDSYDDDDEILANYKMELQNDAILDTVQQKHFGNGVKTKLKKCKMKSDIGIKPQKDWSKIAEWRGNGPILRENSLKLLANSTIFAFQWNKSRYRCFCCKEPFTDVNLLREHSNTHHTLKTIEKKIIVQQNRLVKVDISILKCQICDESLQNLCALKEHLIKIHKIQFELGEDLLVPFKIGGELSCQICTESFSVFRLLNIHMNRHYQKQVCHICGAGFSNLVFLNLHKTRTHKPVKCRHCDLSFNTKIDKKNHEISIHNIKSEKKLRFPCSYCNERFYQEYLRVQHLVEKHGLKRPEVKCDICSKIFLTKSLCNNHLKSVHLKEKNHECEICHNYYYTRSDLHRHKVSHTGEKNFSCELCNNAFASRDSVRRHMRRTHGVNIAPSMKVPRPDVDHRSVFV